MLVTLLLIKTFPSVINSICALIIITRKDCILTNRFYSLKLYKIMNFILLIERIAMRLFYVIVLTCLFSTILNAGIIKGQKINNSITLQVDKEPAVKVFARISELSGYMFFYDENTIKSIFITLNTKNNKIDNILKEISIQTKLVFKQIDNTISVNILLPEKPAGNNSLQQQIKVTGIVRDENGTPLPGVNVIIRGTNTGVITDFEGRYSTHQMANLY